MCHIEFIECWRLHTGLSVDIVVHPNLISSPSIHLLNLIFIFNDFHQANPVKYEEGRELKDFIAYLKENSHNDHDEL